MTLSLFEDEPRAQPSRDELCDGAVVLRGFALANEAAILAAVAEVSGSSPFRHMITPGGFRMSVAMTSCGSCGWVTDRSGYRYEALDPESGEPWLAMPLALRKLAHDAAASAGFAHFDPDSCLINRYVAGARMSLHQDKDERDFTQPIVSVSLGLPAVFLFGGPRRNDKPIRVPLVHGDVVVWGGAARLRYHGVAPLKEGQHSLLGEHRVNLTFRKAR